MRILDAFMAFPTILLYMIIISALGASPINVVIAISIGGAPGIARLVRALTLDIRTREYVSAAKLRGDSAARIMAREILPNCRGPLIVDFLLRVGYAAFYIGTLGFLGLGLPPPRPDWGGMVQEGHARMTQNPWPVLAATAGHRHAGHRPKPLRRRLARRDDAVPMSGETRFLKGTWFLRCGSRLRHV